MEVIPIEIFGLAIDVPFSAPIGFAAANLEEFGTRICDPKQGLGIRAEHVRLRRFDELFDYEVKAQFFGENGTLSRTAERVKLGVRNARTAGDWNIIHQTFTRFYNLMDFDPDTLTTLSAHVHAKFPCTDERDGFLRQFAHGGGILRPAALGYVQIPDWEKDIRFVVEQSNVVPDAVFVAWDTQFPNMQDWDSFLGTLPTMMENSANLFELGFEPLRQTA